MSENTEITLISAPRENIIAAYRDANLMEGIISAVEESVRAEIFDVTTLAGREAAKSLAYKVARSKTFIDAIGKDLTEEARRVTADVNARRKVITDRLDALRDEVKAGAAAWEQAETERKDALLSRMKVFQDQELWSLLASEPLKQQHDKISAIAIDDSWQEFQAEAEIAKAAALAHIEMEITRAEAAEAERRELEELRAFKAEQERIKAEAEEAKRREAAEREAEDRRRKDEAERAEREARAAAEREAEAKRREAAAAEAAALRERQRIEQEQERERAEAEKLARNKKHRAAVKSDAVDFLARFTNIHDAEAAFEAIAAGECLQLKVIF